MSCSVNRRAAFTLFSCAVLAGCATKLAPPATLSPERTASEYAARSLRDGELRTFLADTLGREPAAEPWDFETLSWVAFRYHPSLEVARAQWATARAAQASAAVRPNPTVTLTPGYNFTREVGVSPWFPGINVDVLLFTSTKRQRQQDIARAEAEAARLAVVATAWQVRSELRRALTDLAFAGRRVNALRAHAGAQRSVVALLEQRFNAGGATATEQATARVALLRAEAAAAEAQSQTATARARVAAALGLPASAVEQAAFASPPLAPVFSAEAFAAAREDALRGRSDILAALAKYHALHAALELEVAKQVPDFHLGPGYQWDQGAHKWSLAVSLELPLFHRNEAAIVAATARRAEAAAQFVAVQAQTVAAIDAARAAQAAAAQQLDHARRLRAEIQQQSEHVAQRVNLGAADQLELQLARTEAVAADTLMVEAEAAAAVAAGQLEDALQLPFPHLAALADPARVHSSATR